MPQYLGQLLAHYQDGGEFFFCLNVDSKLMFGVLDRLDDLEPC